MTAYANYAADMYQKIVEKTPANGCTVEEKNGFEILDMGKNEPGGWTSVKLLLEGLMGGRGIVSVSRDFRGMHQFPAVEILYDDPVLTYHMAYEKNSIGVFEDGKAVLGVFNCPMCAAGKSGNLVITGTTSLAYAALQASKALPDAIRLLLDEGIPEDAIQWAWSFAPIADLSLNEKVLAANIEKANARRTVSVWVRGVEDDVLAAIAPKYESGTLRLHSLTTAHTMMADGPVKQINVNKMK